MKKYDPSNVEQKVRQSSMTLKIKKYNVLIRNNTQVGAHAKRKGQNIPYIFQFQNLSQNKKSFYQLIRKTYSKKNDFTFNIKNNIEIRMSSAH